MKTETESAGGKQKPTARDSDNDGAQFLGKDEVFHLLQNSRRRAVVRYFATFDGPVGIGDLAEQVAAWECDTPVDEVTKNQRQRVYIALYQSHLDKLAAHDVIDYDGTQGAITTAENFLVLRDHLAANTEDVPTTDSESDDSDANVPWSSCYLGIAVGGLVPMAGQVLHMVPDGALSLQALNLVLVVAYAATVASQFLVNR